jgi:hypothetical protein
VIVLRVIAWAALGLVALGFLLGIAVTLAVPAVRRRISEASSSPRAPEAGASRGGAYRPLRPLADGPWTDSRTRGSIRGAHWFPQRGHGDRGGPN